MLRIDAAGLRSRVSPLTGTQLGLETRERPYRRPERTPKGHDLRELARRVTTLREALDPFTRNLSLLAASSQTANEAREVREELDAEAAAEAEEVARRDEQFGNESPAVARAERAHESLERIAASSADGPSPALREHVVRSLHGLASALEGLASVTGGHDALDEAAAEVARELGEESERVLSRAFGERAAADEPRSIEERFGGAGSPRHVADDETSFAAEALGLVSPAQDRGEGARRPGPRLSLDDARVERALRTSPRAVARVLGGADGRDGVVGGLRRAAESAVQRLASQLGPNEGTGILLDVSA